MSSQSGSNAEVLLDFVTKSPGRFTKAELLRLFEGPEAKSAAISLGRLMGGSSGKIIERNGRLYPGEVTPPATAPSPVPAQNLSVHFEMPYVVEEFIDVPQNALSRRLEVEFAVKFHLGDVKRIGVSNTTNQSDIFWLPPGGTVLRAAVGDLAVTADMELNTRQYLCVVVKQGGKHVVRYHKAPAGENFVLSWDNAE